MAKPMTNAAVLVIAALLCPSATGCRHQREPEIGERVLSKSPSFDAEKCGESFPRLQDKLRRGAVTYYVLRCPSLEGGALTTTSAVVPRAIERSLAPLASWFVPLVIVHLAISVLMAWYIMGGGLYRSFRELSQLAAEAAKRRSNTQLAGDGLPVLAPVACGSCGTHVPLVDAASTPCPSCGEQVPIPGDYREPVRWRRAAHRALMRASRVWRLLELLERPSVRNTWTFLKILFVPVFAPTFAVGVSLGSIHGYFVAFGVGYLVTGLVLVLAPLFVRLEPRPRARGSLSSEGRALAQSELAGRGACPSCGAELLSLSAAEVVLGCSYCGHEHLLANRARRARDVVEAKATWLLDDTLQAARALGRLWLAFSFPVLVGLALSVVAGLVGTACT